jgi:hypothetical protein
LLPANAYIGTVSTAAAPVMVGKREQDEQHEPHGASSQDARSSDIAGFRLFGVWALPISDWPACCTMATTIHGKAVILRLFLLREEAKGRRAAGPAPLRISEKGTVREACANSPGSGTATTDTWLNNALLRRLPPDKDR